jgi:DedD protein
MKQRLVGAMVLVSLGVIFLPSLFSREGDGDGRVAVNTQSLIPPKPDVRTIVIESPQATTQIPAPHPNDAFQPDAESALSEQEIESILNASTAKKAKDAKVSASKDLASTAPGAKEPSPKKSTVSTPTPASTPTIKLDKKGLPESWVIQTASFQSQSHADALNKKLLDKNYKAYVRSVKTSKGQFYRVLVGPYIDLSRAATAKKDIDKIYRLKSQILRFSDK